MDVKRDFCYTDSMRRRRSTFLLLVGIFSFILIAYFVLFFPPNWIFQIGPLDLSIQPLFFFFLFLFVFSQTAYFSKNLRRGVLFGAFIVSYFVLRLLNLTHIFFLALLLGFLLTLELFFQKRH